LTTASVIVVTNGKWGTGLSANNCQASCRANRVNHAWSGMNHNSSGKRSTLAVIVITDTTTMLPTWIRERWPMLFSILWHIFPCVSSGLNQMTTLCPVAKVCHWGDALHNHNCSRRQVLELLAYNLTSYSHVDLSKIYSVLD
jgi:hypothetical protein